jgi:hypothetical protein
MTDDLRIHLLSKSLRLKHYELNNNNNISTHEYFEALALEVINTLDKYYGSKKYWMAAEFEREKILRELETTIDRIRNANISP